MLSLFVSRSADVKTAFTAAAAAWRASQCSHQRINNAARERVPNIRAETTGTADFTLGSQTAPLYPVSLPLPEGIATLPRIRLRRECSKGRPARQTSSLGG